MKVYTAGSRFWGGQVDRIDSGIKELGHEVTQCPKSADILYSNDPGGYDEIIAEKLAGSIRGKIVFNVQDIPTHLVGYDVNKLREKLLQADVITSISGFTRGELNKHCGLNSTVVYQPIKLIFADKCYVGVEGKYRIRFLSVGRRFDANKRAAIWVAALDGLGIPQAEVGLVGNEGGWGGWGNYIGVQTDEHLAVLYNAVDFVMQTSRTEGMGLPAIEAMAAGAIPVICNDLTTREEFFPSTIFPEYLDVYPNPVSVARFIAHFLNNDAAMEDMKARLKRHYQESWSEKLSPKGVASAILKAVQ